MLKLIGNNMSIIQIITRYKTVVMYCIFFFWHILGDYKTKKVIKQCEEGYMSNPKGQGFKIQTVLYIFGNHFTIFVQSEQQIFPERKMSPPWM